MTLNRNVIVTIGMLGVLSGCGEEPVGETVERVRAIKTYTVSEPAGGDVGRYSGTIAASDTSTLSFALRRSGATATGLPAPS